MFVAVLVVVVVVVVVIFVVVVFDVIVTVYAKKVLSFLAVQRVFSQELICSFFLDAVLWF